MHSTTCRDMTALLRQWTRGDPRALDRLMPVLYQELRRTARAYMRGEHASNTLETGALLNEAWLRLTQVRKIEWRDRSHFYASAAQTMRRVLVDQARSRRYLKRGAGARRVPLTELMLHSSGWEVEILDLDGALGALEELDPRKAQMVEMRFFAGLSVTETASALGVSEQTVLRDWNISKAWLARHMRSAHA
ncbi:MAG: sigma-70 family RNA polymerase sigma factor [Bryobacteraceae bacterium]